VRADAIHLLKAAGVGALMVTHDPEEALFMGDKIALMNRGRVLQQGSALDLYLAPQTPMVAEFFGEINRLGGRVEGGEVITPFGPVAALGLADGTPVDILIRSEGVQIQRQAPDGNTPPQAQVQAVRLLGRASLIHLQTLPGTGFDQHLHIRTHGTSRLKPGMTVWMHLDPELAFVFPAASEIPGKPLDFIPGSDPGAD
jgi:iron(III) transport system ATP-binding protein